MGETEGYGRGMGETEGYGGRQRGMGGDRGVWGRQRGMGETEEEEDFLDSGLRLRKTLGVSLNTNFTMQVATLSGCPGSVTRERGGNHGE